MMGLAIRRYLAAGAFALLLASHAAVYLAGRSHASTEAETRGMKATIEQLRERGLIDEAVGNLDDSDLCLELGGVPEFCNAQ